MGGRRALRGGARPARSLLQGCSGTRTPRARARPAAPGAPRPRPASNPAGREPLSTGARGPGGWGLGASPRCCWRRGRSGLLEEEWEQEGEGGGGGGGAAGSSSSERGHVHGTPPGRAANRSEALRAASADLPQGTGPRWGTLEDPAPTALARPNYLSRSSLGLPSSLASPSSLQPRAPRSAPAPGARVGAPSGAPGQLGCEGIFHSFLSWAQTGSGLLPLGCSRCLESAASTEIRLSGRVFRGVYVWWCWEGARPAHSGER